MLILFVICAIKVKGKKSNLIQILIKILSEYGLLINTVLIVPFFNVFIAGLICSKDSYI